MTVPYYIDNIKDLTEWFNEFGPESLIITPDSHLQSMRNFNRDSKHRWTIWKGVPVIYTAEIR